jgi:hypothetical protein
VLSIYGAASRVRHLAAGDRYEHVCVRQQQEMAARPIGEAFSASPAPPFRQPPAFDPAVLCRAQTTAALQARAALRVQSGREP